MNDVLCHPLGLLPWAFLSADGSLRKTNKVSLAQELQKNYESSRHDSTAGPYARIMDGMAMVWKTRGDLKTFAEVADSVTSLVLLEGKDSQHIDVFLDFYRDNLVKNLERQKRG